MKVKPNELRLGNWVNNILHKEEMQVDHNIIRWLVNDEYPEDFKPIPLTEEWLVKFGFEIDFDWCELGGFSISKDFNKKKCVFEVNGVYNQIPFPEHVHQLQNLYFALTGSELVLTK